MLILSKALRLPLTRIIKIRPQRIFFKHAFTFSQSSRDIEIKMAQEQFKNVQNKFKSLQIHFGLNRPEEVGKQYQKPSTIQYTMESLRMCSHRYPQYLLNELKNPNSQFYQVIEQSFNGLAHADNKESIQFLAFLVKWKIYEQKEDYLEIIARKIFQMDMDLNELFKVLNFVVAIDKSEARNFIMQDIQNKILQHVVDIQVHEYESLFKMLNFMRIHDLCPKIKPDLVKELNKQIDEDQQPLLNQDSFFRVVQSVLIRNIDKIPIPSLAEMVVHYANNIKEDHDDMINILTKSQPRIIENIAFFNHDELIAILFSYIKTNTISQKMIQQFVRRVELLYFEISWQNKKRILNLASSLPHIKWQSIVSISIFEVLKGRKVIHRDGKKQTDASNYQVEYQLLPTIYLAAYETNLATEQLITKLQQKILLNIFNYTAQDLGLIAWLFTITPPTIQIQRSNRDVLYTKLEVIIEGGFNKSTFTLKDISMLVWAMCNTGGKSNFVYKENAQFWNNIEFYIQDRISNKKEERLFNSCCQIMWAYCNNKPLKVKTINMILDLIIEKQQNKTLEEQMFVFELTTITTFFSSLKHSLPKSIVSYIQNLTIKYFQILIQEMRYIQIMKMLKHTIYDENNKLKQDRLSAGHWEKIIDQFIFDADRVDYSSIMGVIGFAVLSPQGQKADQKVIDLVKKLMARKAKLQQLKVQPQ